MIKNLTIEIMFTADTVEERDALAEGISKSVEIAGGKTSVRTATTTEGPAAMVKIYASDDQDIEDFISMFSLLDRSTDTLRGEKDEIPDDDTWGTLVD